MSERKMRRGSVTGVPRGPNRIPREVREAILRAFQEAGGWRWLHGLSQGTVEQQRVFAALVGKVIPKTVEGEVQQSVVVSLPWLTGRQITAARPPLEAERCEGMEWEVKREADRSEG